MEQSDLHLAVPTHTSETQLRALKSAWLESLDGDQEVPVLCVEASLATRADPAQVVAWITVITASGSALKVFMEAVAKRTGEALGEVLVKRLAAIRDIAGSRKSKSIILYRDRDTGVTAILRDDLDPEALAALLKLDLSQFEEDPIEWDPEKKKWGPSP